VNLYVHGVVTDPSASCQLHPPTIIGLDVPALLIGYA